MTEQKQLNKDTLNNLQEILSQLKHNFNRTLTEILENMDITDNAFEDIIDFVENLDANLPETLENVHALIDSGRYQDACIIFEQWFHDKIGDGVPT